MKYLSLLFLYCFLFPALSWGQDIKSQMAQIKKDPAYFKVETNSGDYDSAFEMACSELLNIVNDELKAKGDTVAYTKETLVPLVQSLSLQRGEDRIRVLAYISRSVIDGTEEQSPSVLKTEEVPSADLLDEAVVINLFGTKPTVVENLSDTIPVHNAVVEEPLAESAPIIAQISDSVEVVDQPDGHQIPLVASLSETESAAVEEAVPEEKSEPMTEATPSADLSFVLESLMQMETARDVLDALRQFKEMGRVKEYGGIRSAQVNLSAKYIIVFSKQKQTLRALLTPEVQGKRTDLLTNKDSELSEYKGEVAVLFE